MHQVKGSEFKIVFVVALEEEIFPHINAKDADEIEEERRIFYVALTRAKERVILSSAHERYRFGRPEIFLPSRFITETNIETEESFGINPSVFQVKERKRRNPEKLNLADKVIHETFGFGTIISITDEIVKVAFELPYGVKEFMPNHPSIKKVKN